MGIGLNLSIPANNNLTISLITKAQSTTHSQVYALKIVFPIIMVALAGFSG